MRHSGAKFRGVGRLGGDRNWAWPSNEIFAVVRRVPLGRRSREFAVFPAKKLWKMRGAAWRAAWGVAWGAVCGARRAAIRPVRRSRVG
jgi:hypothetical protein